MITEKDVEVVSQFEENIPVYAHDTDAGCDLKAKQPEMLFPNQTRLIDAGIKIKIPDGYYGMVVSRSGLSSKRGIVVLNSPGIIDSSYTGPIKVILHNFSDSPYQITKNERIAQLILMKYEKINFVPVESLEETERGSNGFGSSGQ